MDDTIFSPCKKIIFDYIKSAERFDMDSQHYHDAYEIYFQADGERYMFLDDICYTLRRGDVVILTPFVIHYMESRDIEYYERYVINFSSDMLKCILSDDDISRLLGSVSSCVFNVGESRMDSVKKAFERISFFYENGGYFGRKLTASAVFQLAAVLNDLSAGAEKITSRHTPEEITAALAYINKNYVQDIDLETIAETIHMSKYHFSRLFRKATGATFLQYLNNVRLVNAHHLLTDTSKNLEQIAFSTGFSSGAHLSRVFKQVYGISPRQFRQDMRGDVK